MNFFVPLLCLLAIGPPSALASPSDLAPDEAMIIENAIHQPLNCFLLIQRKDYLGAVIFGPLEQSDKGIFIRYRAFKKSSAGWQLDKEDAIGIRNPKWWGSMLGMVGIHVPPRIHPLELKDITLMANPRLDGTHAIVYFGRPGTLELDPAIKLAPTPWREIKEVNEKDGRLKWFSANGLEQVMKIDDLWKK
jgi:hypothetical protein